MISRCVSSVNLRWLLLMIGAGGGVDSPPKVLSRDIL